MGGSDHNNKDDSVSLGYRLSSQRERLIGMTDDERAWRAKFVKSQILDPDEPKMTAEYYKLKYNPIRRFYRAPLDKLESMLAPRVGATCADGIRYITAKTGILIAFTYFSWYYFKYNAHDWTKFGGWRVTTSRMIEFPSDPGFPSEIKKPKGNEFNVYGFDKSPI